MKHTKKITILLLTLFLLTQVIGLFIVDSYALKTKEIIDGKEVEIIQYEQLPYDLQRPDFNEETSYLPMIFMIIIVTFFAMMIIKFRAEWLWKGWFFLSILFCLLISFSVFISQFIAFILSTLLAYFKVFKRSVITQNLPEIFIYGGLAAVFVPIMSLWSVIIFLIIISVYDYIAVNKTKHMVKLAESHTKMKIFPGLMIPYGKKVAILGGGDLGLPLIFAGVVMKSFGNLAYIIPIFTTLSLYYLLSQGKKNKFYPAMPILTLGSLIGYFIILLI